MRVIKSSPNVGHESLSTQLEKLLIGPLKRTGLATIIITDALDECKEPYDQPASVILALLPRYIDEIPSVKFFITGRPEPRIRSGFRLPLLRSHTEVLLLHEVEKQSVNHDIEIFLRARLSEFAASRSDIDVTVLWPAEEDFSVLVRKSDGLFIYADTVLKFITSSHGSPEHRLLLITSMPDGSTHEGPSRIDPLYIQLLREGYADVESSMTWETFYLFRLIVGTIVVSLNPRLISTCLRPLHSVLLVPDSDCQTIRTYHKSFPDYIIDNARCQNSEFYIDPGIHHAKMAILCLELMMKMLKKNICNLLRYSMNSDSRREKGRGRAEFPRKEKTDHE